MAKTALFTDQTGAIVAGADDNSVTVTGWNAPVVIGAEFSNTSDTLKVQVLKADGSTYGSFNVDRADGGRGAIVLSKQHTQVTLTIPGTYALSGTVVGSTTGFKADADYDALTDETALDALDTLSAPAAADFIAAVDDSDTTNSAAGTIKKVTLAAVKTYTNNTMTPAAGTADPGTAPLKFTSGVLNTTPEAGAIEFDGTNLYFVNDAGVRKQITVEA